MELKHVANLEQHVVYDRNPGDNSDDRDGQGEIFKLGHRNEVGARSEISQLVKARQSNFKPQDPHGDNQLP